eukprot:m.171253 g.171253  ORF g.171253 m.171253 type:complete len:310 (-) comp9934_c0_seq17:1018-1947(-)
MAGCGISMLRYGHSQLWLCARRCLATPLAHPRVQLSDSRLRRLHIPVFLVREFGPTPWTFTHTSSPQLRTAVYILFCVAALALFIAAMALPNWGSVNQTSAYMATYNGPIYTGHFSLQYSMLFYKVVGSLIMDQSAHGTTSSVWCTLQDRGGVCQFQACVFALLHVIDDSRVFFMLDTCIIRNVLLAAELFRPAVHLRQGRICLQRDRGGGDRGSNRRTAAQAADCERDSGALCWASRHDRVGGSLLRAETGRAYYRLGYRSVCRGPGFQLLHRRLGYCPLRWPRRSCLPHCCLGDSGLPQVVHLVPSW